MVTVLVVPFRVDRHNPIEEAKPLPLRDLANLESYFVKYYVQLDAKIEYSRLISKINQLAVTRTACLTPTMSGCVMLVEGLWQGKKVRGERRTILLAIGVAWLFR
jgi:hypothetical protein